MRRAIALWKQSLPKATDGGERATQRSLPISFLGFALPGIVLIYLYYDLDIRLVYWPLSVSHFPIFRDFSNLWVGAIDAINHRFDLLFGERAHVAELGRRLGIPEPDVVWFYPPTALLLVLPFGFLPFGVAALVWTIAGAASFLLAAGVRNVPRHDLAPWLVAIALCPGVFVCAAYGQTAFLTSAAVIVGLIEAQRRPMLAGACFALLVAKPQVAIAIPVVLIALRAWPAMAWAAVFGSIYLAATLVAFGIEPWGLFLDITLPNQLRIMNASRFDPILMSSPYFMLRGFGVSPSISYSLQLLISVAAIIWLYAAVRAERDGNMQILLAACATLLASAYMRSYELPLLLAAVARILVSADSLRDLDRRQAMILVLSVTILPLLAWLAACIFKVNVLALIPFGLLAIFGWRAISRETASHGAFGPARVDHAAR